MIASITAAAGECDAALAALWVEAWQATMPAIDFDGRRSWIGEELIRLRESGATVLVAYVADTPAGFVTVTRLGRVDQLAVARRYQRHGIGGMLLDAARTCASAPLQLTVNADNAGAVRFYEREGFVSVGAGVNEASGLPTLFLVERARTTP